MWRNYLVTAVRHMLKHRLFSAINIVGLSLGLAAAMAILLFVRDELSVDGFWRGGDRLYSVAVHDSNGPSGNSLNWTPGPLGDVLERHMSDLIEDMVRAWPRSQTLLLDQTPVSAMSMLVEPGFFTLFEHQVIAGDPAAAIADPAGVVVTGSAAQRFFGTTDVVGAVLEFSGGRQYKVGAVVADLAGRSMLEYDLLMPLDIDSFLDDAGNRQFRDWGFFAFLTLVQAREGVTKAMLDARYAEIEPEFGRSAVEDTAAHQHEFIAIGDLYLDGPSRGTTKPAGDRGLISSFLAGAVVILLIGTINFMNLATVRLTLRDREIAVRKVFGARRQEITVQFLAESFVLVALSLLLAVALIELGLPALNTLMAQSLAVHYAGDPALLFGLAALGVLTTLGAGLYPAFFASRTAPASVLAGGRSTSRAALRLRQGLVVLQFTAALVLIIAAQVISGQLNHLRTFDRGFDSENLFSVWGAHHPDIAPRREGLKTRLLAHPDIDAVTYSWTQIGVSRQSVFTTDQVNGETVEPKAFVGRYVDPDYFTTTGIRLLAGRTHDRSRPADQHKWQTSTEAAQAGPLVISASAARLMGYGDPADAVGGRLSVDGDVPLRVIGVVADTFVDGEGNGTEPTVYLWQEQQFQVLHARLRSEAARQALLEIWTSLAPDSMPSLLSVKEAIADRYKAERLAALLMQLFAGLAALISLMGLYGLASFTAVRRSREISMRKLMGASTWQVALLMMWQFSKPVMLASLVALPAAFWIMQDWLQAFPERISIGPLLLLGPVGLAVGLAWATVAGNSVRLARTKPADVLRMD